MLAKERAVEISLFLLRGVTGLLFLQHGAQKLFGWFAGTPFEAFSKLWFAGVLEFFGGLLILLGAFTRPVAFILSGLMAVAYFTSHQPKGTWPIENKGEPAVLFCFIFLFLAAFGGGRWSIDVLLRSKRGIGGE